MSFLTYTSKQIRIFKLGKPGFFNNIHRTAMPFQRDFII
ncbi:Uncharacterized protein dnl_55900 [Desulfonema limicola]|uniref:Uncharacterized protein n=1 Tax=Desulfonema limicola TaxID=45656 RepID=A0A975BCK6_9BACT|nr:Uncharacterized protein dnl_55900 [Desulfonema limicola]